MPDRLAILGVGLIGGSVGMAARAAVPRQWHVVGYGPEVEALRRAVAVGAIDRSTATAAEAVREADLVVIATPVGSIAGVLSEIAGHLRPGAVVTDVGSTKRSTVTASAALAGSGAAFVGSHPMAGGERGGVDHASRDLLGGSVCVVTPTAEVSSATVNTVERFWRSLGMRTVRLSPDEHDRLVASISHAPHAVAAALVRAAVPTAVPLAAGGYRDATRVAAGDPAVWRDIFIDNRDHVRAAVERVRAELGELVGRLDRGDAAAVHDWLASAAATKRAGEV